MSISSPSSSSHGGNQSPRSTVHDFIGLPTELGKPQPRVELEALDIRRKKIAETKAQKLLEATLTGNCPSQTPASPTGIYPDNDDNGYAVRQRAIQAHKEKKRQAKIRAMTGESSENIPEVRTLPILLAEAGMERMATSNRKNKAISPEEEVETIQDYKTGLDMDREKEARSQALSLLKGAGAVAFL
jgi:hypothetical protein